MIGGEVAAISELLFIVTYLWGLVTHRIIFEAEFINLPACTARKHLVNIEPKANHGWLSKAYCRRGGLEKYFWTTIRRKVRRKKKRTQ
jgi:hypothetical protein